MNNQNNSALILIGAILTLTLCAYLYVSEILSPFSFGVNLLALSIISGNSLHIYAKSRLMMFGGIITHLITSIILAISFIWSGFVPQTVWEGVLLGVWSTLTVWILLIPQTPSKIQLSPIQQKLVSILPIVIVCTIIVVAIGFRIPNLTNLYPYTDEYPHLLKGYFLNKGGTYDYTRADMVSYLVGFMYQFTGAQNFQEYLYWGRMPGVIFSALTVIPVYFLGKRVSNTTGYIAALLWAIAPWAIGVARTVREYAYYPLFTTLGLVSYLAILEAIVQRKKITAWFVLQTLYILSLAGYAIILDPKSTLKIFVLLVLITTGAFALTHQGTLRKFLRENTKLLVGSIIPVILLIGVGVLQLIDSQHIVLSSVLPEYQWADMFFTSLELRPTQWWDGIITSAIISFFVGASLVMALRNKNKGFITLALIFLGMLLFYIFFFNRYVRPRYIFYLMPIFTVLIAYIPASIFNHIARLGFRTHKFYYVSIFGVILVFMGIFNITNSTQQLFSAQQGYINETGEFHDDVTGLVKKLDSLMNPNEKIVTTVFRPLIIMKYQANLDDFLMYDYKDSKRFREVEGFLSKNNTGLIVIDSRRNGGWTEGFPRTDTFLFGRRKVSLIYNEDGTQIYRWEPINEYSLESIETFVPGS